MLSTTASSSATSPASKRSVVETCDSDDAAVDLPANGTKNKLSGADPQQVTLVQLRLLTGQNA